MKNLLEVELTRPTLRLLRLASHLAKAEIAYYLALAGFTLRSRAAAAIAVAIRIAALRRATSSSDWVKAPRAVASSAAPSGSGSCSAAASAPPSVLRASCAASGGTPAGRESAILLRYKAVPALPRIAMPSAPPSSEPVSEIADAAPARSGGALPTIRSVARVNTGASPRE